MVARATAAGITVLGLTDHDTTAGCPATATACARASIAFVPGIEITANRDDADVHVLGYFLDIEDPGLLRFLDEQRRQRIDRVREMVRRLDRLGIALDGESIVGPAVADPTRSAGRPWIARALVAAGRAADTAEAFDRWLGRGRPAYVPRPAGAPSDIVARIHDAGGIASLAHPGLLRHDEWIAPMVAGGLDALEAYHTDHDQEATLRYLAMADRFGIAVSGGSDFHGDLTHGALEPGAASLPPDAYERLRAAARRRPAADAP